MQRLWATGQVRAPLVGFPMVQPLQRPFWQNRSKYETHIPFHPESSLLRIDIHPRVQRCGCKTPTVACFEVRVWNYLKDINKTLSKYWNVSITVINLLDHVYFALLLKIRWIGVDNGIFRNGEKSKMGDAFMLKKTLSVCTFYVRISAKCCGKYTVCCEQSLSLTRVPGNDTIFNPSYKQNLYSW